MTDALWIQLIAIVAAVACVLPGVFLVLRGMALMSDAISHTVLLGIAVGFLLGGSLQSPLLMIGAASTGVLTVVLVEALAGTRLVKRDAAIGLVFPALFSIGVILVSHYAGKVHLDTHMVLLGELALAPFDRLEIAGRDFGPRTMWTMGVALFANAAFIGIFWKELKLATFDAALAASLGFFPAVLHYALMSLVSVTAVAAFDAVGSILVVALMVVPAATAYLLTDRLGVMVFFAAGIGAVGAILGYWLAHYIDAPVAGCMATMLGALFLVAFAAAPDRGLVARALRRLRQRDEFARAMLAIHLSQHEGRPEETVESRQTHLQEHFRWTPARATQVVRSAVRRGIVTINPAGSMQLTDLGRTTAREALVR